MKRRTLLCAALCVVLIAAPVSAWEADVHYGLTKWLAYEAGFSLADAEKIAQGTEDPDEGFVKPAPIAVAIACITRDYAGAQFVKEFHFPSKGKAPGPPDGRIVVPGESENAATTMVDKVLDAHLAGQPRDKALKSLGEALHPLEDSWSHQGLPDSPFPPLCDRDFSSGHPVKRGGWRLHDADLTYLHGPSTPSDESDTLQTARKTYDKMIAFLTKHPEFVERGADGHLRAPKLWSSLDGQVIKFERAATKADKRAWFSQLTDVPFPDLGFLRDINLPEDRLAALSSAVRPTLGAASLQLVSAQMLSVAPVDAKKFADLFLIAWIVKHDLRYASTMINRSAFARPFVREPDEKSEDIATRSILAMWLIKDHGLVNKLGHGLNPENTARFETLNQPKIEVSSLEGAISGSNGALYDSFRVVPDGGPAPPSNNTYVIVFRFRHAPRDAVMLLLTQDNKGKWLVDALSWYVL
jgi:hypothetical protein